jgi:hypothetical protein
MRESAENHALLSISAHDRESITTRRGARRSMVMDGTPSQAPSMATISCAPEEVPVSFAVVSQQEGSTSR